MNLKNLRLWVFLFGAIFLIAAFLFQQSTENRNQLQLQSMKSIDLTKQNFLETYDNYHNQLDSYLRRYFYSKISGENDPAKKMVEIFDKENRFRISQISLVNEGDLKGNFFENSQISLFTSDSTFVVEKDYLFNLDYDSLYRTSSDSLRKLTEILKDDPNFNFKGSWELAGTSRTFRVTHAIDIYNLMKHNLNDDFFDAIYITDSSGNILFPSRDIGLDLFDQSQFRRNMYPSNEDEPMGEGEVRRPNLVGNQHFKLNISSVQQEIFSTGLKLGTQQLYLIGAKDSDHFSQVALRINFNLLSAFILSLLFILASIPIISIIKLDTGDILSKAKVYGVGLSLIMLAVILGFSISYVRHQTQNPQYPEKIFKIKKSFIEQIAPFSTILNNSASILHPLNPLTNEFIQFNNRGMILEMKLNSLQTQLEFKRPFVSIANRDYVQNLFKNDAFSQKKFISAHYSQGTGKLEGVISNKISDNLGNALTFKLDSLLNDIRGDERFFIFKEGGKIIFNSNKIKILVSSLEEAIGEKKWKEIETLINNHKYAVSDKAIWRIPLYVNGYEYGGVLSKIRMDQFDQSLWVLFLVDHNLQHAKTSLTAAEATAFFIAYFLLLFLLSFLNSLANKQSVYLNIQSFSYSWFGPSPEKRNRFIILNYILLFDILGFTIIYNSVKMDIFAVFLFACLFSIHASLCKFVLIFPRQHQRMGGSGYKFLIPAGLLFILTLYSLIYYLEINPRETPIAIFVILILMVLFFLGIFIREFSSARTKTINFNLFPLQKTFYMKFSRFWYRVSRVNDDKRIFAISFTLWTVLIGFIPGYVVHRSMSHHEDFIWNQSQIPQDLQRQDESPDPDFIRLISKYEGIRRTSFYEISDQDETFVKNFLAPDQTVIFNSFKERNVYQNKENGGIGSEGGTVFLFNEIQIIVSIILLITLFILVIFLTQRIYLTEYLFTHSRYKLPLLANNSRRNFIICIDNQVAIDWICYQFGFKADEVFVYDFIEHPGLDDLVLIEFEKVLILQNIHCVKNLFEFSRALVELTNQYIPIQKPIFITSGSSIKDLMSIPGEPHEKLLLSEVFSQFMSYTIPINFQRESFHLPYTPTPLAKMDMEGRKQIIKLLESPLFKDPKVRILENEVFYGANSKSLSAIITDEICQEPLKEKMSMERFEKCLLSIQRHNKGFYINIWNELDPKERKMVFYYAREGFINYSNRDTLTELIQKGIFTLIPDEEGLVLFSRSFRNFVTLMISEKEIFQFKEDERIHGNVANIRTAAFSFIFLSIAVISYYDPSVLNKTSAYVSGIIGLIGTITSFLSKGLGNFFSKNKDDNS